MDIEDEPAPCVFYRDRLAHTLASGTMRQADVALCRDKVGQESLISDSGTSLLDVKSVFKGQSWLSFGIPVGTLVPTSRIVCETGFNQHFNASHRQFECAAKSMCIGAFKGALDSLLRNTIARTVGPA